jgi:hypothetical protein
VLIPHSAIRDGPVFRIQPTGWTASGDSHRNGRCLSSQLSKRRYNSTGIALTDLDAADNANVCQRLSKVVPFEVFLLIVSPAHRSPEGDDLAPFVGGEPMSASWECEEDSQRQQDGRKGV